MRAMVQEVEEGSAEKEKADGICGGVVDGHAARVGSACAGAANVVGAQGAHPHRGWHR
jgi:hypothetical protein